MNLLGIHQWRNRWLLVLVALLSATIIACKTSPADIPAAQPATPLPSQPTATISPVSAQPTPTLAPWDAAATSRRTPAPAGAASARDSIVMVTNGEPDQLGAFSPGCSGNARSLVCEDAASDPLTWINSTTFEVVPLSGVDRWEQISPDRWRFFLRDGVTFHNGEPWTAAAAKLGVDTHGDRETAGNGTGSYGFHFAIKGEVVDDLTLDIVCDADCPILPRTTMFLKFQAPEWWAASDQATRESTTMGFGPYRMVEWRRGVEVELERFPNYQPNSTFGAQAPVIERAFQVWRDEGLARAALVASGEADLAFDIGPENMDLAPRALAGDTNEVYFLVADNIWHPELRKKQVREALNLAIDCQALMDTLYYGLPECWGNISPEGSVGINPQNSAAYPYNPQRATELLEAAGYSPANEITIHTRQDRVFSDVELWESVISMWQEVGVNARLQVLGPDSHREVRRSGCGNFRVDSLQCAQYDPPGPALASSHYYEVATTSESMDLQRQLLLRASCFNVNSRICNLSPGLEDAINDATTTPMGPLRTARLEALAQTIHDEFWFVPLFQVKTAYGLAEDLEWTPRHDPRARINTMRFSQ